jgi:hypothetical protein
LFGSFGAVLRVSRKLAVDGRVPRKIRSRAIPPDEPFFCPWFVLLPGAWIITTACVE